MTCKVYFTPTARQMFRAITNPRRSTLLERIGGLKTDPEMQGKPLLASLKGYRSLRAAGRYQVVYQVQRSEVTVLVVGLGIRKEGDEADVYELVRKLLDIV